MSHRPSTILTTLAALAATFALLVAAPAAASARTAGDDPASAEADPGMPLARSYPAWVSIDADGRVTAVEVDAGQSAAVAGIVGDLVRELSFEPAARGGDVVASEVPATIGVRFTPESGGAYAASLRWLEVLPLRADLMAPPRYPANELRGAVGGWVTLGYVVTPEGRADMATLDVIDQGAWSGHRLLAAGGVAAKAFVAASRESAARWTFRTARLDGVPVPARLATPTTFRPHDRGNEADDVPGFARAPQAPVPVPVLLGDGLRLPVPAELPEAPPASRADDIRITGSRVRRTGGGGP